MLVNREDLNRTKYSTVLLTELLMSLMMRVYQNDDGTIIIILLITY